MVGGGEGGGGGGKWGEGLVRRRLLLGGWREYGASRSRGELGEACTEGGKRSEKGEVRSGNGWFGEAGSEGWPRALCAPREL